MSPVKREWLLHGCMRLSDEDRAHRVSVKIRRLISAMYEGEEFGIRSEPQRGFRTTLWWYEKSIETPGSAAAYFLSVDNRRGPNLYAGVSVEKAFEDDGLARQYSSRNNQPLNWWRLDEGWDWHRSLSCFSEVERLIVAAAQTLAAEIYLWLEFGESAGQHYVLSQGHLYWRGGFRPAEWQELHDFASRPRPRSWGGFSVARAFSLEECTPQLDDARLMDVFRSMRPVRDLLRGR